MSDSKEKKLLSETRKEEILRHLKENGKLTQPQISEKIKDHLQFDNENTRRTIVSRLLKNLQDEGLIHIVEKVERVGINVNVWGIVGGKD